MTTRPVPIDARLVRLNPYDELQIVTADIPLITVLNAGSVEIFGEFLPPNQIHILLPFTKFSLVALVASEIQLIGMPLFCGCTRENVQRNTQLINLSVILNQIRSEAIQTETPDGDIGSSQQPPRIMVVGGYGRSSVCQTLHNLALKCGWHPIKIDLDSSSGVSSGQLDKILKGYGIITATFTECDNETVQQMLNISSSSLKASDRLEFLRKVHGQISSQMTGEPLLLPKVDAKQHGGRNRKRQSNDSNRLKQSQVLFNIAKKNAALHGAQSGNKHSRAETGCSGDDLSSGFGKGRKRETLPMPFESSESSLIALPTSLSQWERFLRPLIRSNKENAQVQCQHNRTLGVWVADSHSPNCRQSKTSFGYESFKSLFVPAAEQLMDLLNESSSELDNGGEKAFVTASGAIADCAAELSDIDQIMRLGDVLSATHYVVVGRPDISAALQENQRITFEVDELKITWPQPINETIAQTLQSVEEYYLYPQNNSLVPLPVFPVPTKTERRSAGGINLIEGLNANDSSVQMFIQAAVSSQLLPKGVNHPLSSRLLYSPTEVPRHISQIDNMKLAAQLTLLTLCINEKGGSAALRRISKSEFQERLETAHCKLDGALVQLPGSLPIELAPQKEQRAGVNNECQVRDMTTEVFDFTCPLRVVSPVILKKVLREPAAGFQLWSRACYNLLDQSSSGGQTSGGGGGGSYALLISVDK